MIRRLARRVLSWQALLRLVLLTLIIALGVAFWLVGTETGARFTVGWISGLTPGFSMRYGAGTLVGPLRLRTITVKKATRIDIDDATIDWSLPHLLLGRLEIADMHVARAVMTLPPITATPAGAAGKTAAPRLPAVQAPLPMHVGKLVVDEFIVARGDHETRYTQVMLGMDWKNDHMDIGRLVVGMPQWQADATGTLTTAGAWPLDAQLRFVTPRSGAPAFTLAGRAQGSLADAALELDSDGVIAAHVSGHVSPLARGMPFRATLRAAEMRVPPRGDPRRSARLADIALDAHGELTGAMAFDGNTRVETPWTQPVAAKLHADGTWRGLERAELAFADPRFAATLVTDWRWLDGQHFHGHLDVRRLDLALVHPALASRLAGGVDISGDIPPTGAAATPRFDFTATPLAGTLFGRPVTIRGPLRWQESRWTFDDLDLRQGDNRAVLRGTLADVWDVDATLALGDLNTLLPALYGTAVGSTRIAGTPADPHFLFQVDVHALALPAIRLPAPVAHQLRVPEADWHAAGEATLRDVKFSDAHTTGGDFAISTHGTLDWQHGLAWDLDSGVGQFPLARFAPDIFFPRSGGRVSGPFNTRGVLARHGADSALEALAIDTQLTGTFDEQPLAVNGGLDWTPANTTLHDLHLVHGANRLNASGSIDAARVALKLEADAPALENSLRDLAGRVQASVQVGGTRQAPDADVAVQATQLRWRNYALAQLDSALRLVDGAARNSQLHLRAGGFSAGAATPGTPRIDTIEINADGTRNDHHIEFSLESGPLAIALDADGKFANAASWNAINAWSGTLARGSLDLHHWHWEAIGAPALAWHGDMPHATQELTVAPHCWSDSAARACLNAPAKIGASGEVSLEAFHLPLELLLADLLPLDTIVRGRVGGMLDARWRNGRLSHVWADVRNAEPLRVTLAGDENEALRDVAQVDTLAAQATLENGEWHAEATLAGADAGSLHARLAAIPGAGTSTPATGPSAAGGSNPLTLDGSLDIVALRVGLLEAFTYQLHHIGGQVDAKLALGGSSDAPRTSGTIALKNGQFAFTRLPLAIDDIDVDGTFDGNELRLDGSFHTPESPERARIAGLFALDAGNWHGEASLTGNRLFVAMPPEYQFTIAPDLHLAARPGEFAVTGDIRVPAGRIEVKKLPVQSVNLSRDVVIVRAEQPEESRGIGLRQKVDVHLLLGNDIKFRAFNGEGLLTGDLRVRSTPELPLLVDGELHVKDGKYRALGQQLALKNADIIFNGPVDLPLVDALAVRSIDDPAVREVGLKLSGSLRAPQTVLWSSPELPPQEALSWLTTGHALAATPIDTRGEATQAAIAMGMAQGSALLSQAGQEIGLRDVQLSSAGDSTTSEVQVGTNVSDRVFVGYNRRVFTGESSVLLRLQLTRRLMLEALSGVESALDIFYTFEF